MQNKILFALGLIFVGLIAFCYIFLMERVEITDWTGLSENARRNPYLAAEQFLAERGVTVVKTTDILDFDTIPTDQTVLLTQVDSMLVSPRQVAAAQRWIERGGYMIVGVENELEGQNSLLNTFDITPRFVEKDYEFSIDEDSDESVADQMREINRKIEQREQQEELEAQKQADDDSTDSSDAELAEERTNDDSEAQEEKENRHENQWRSTYIDDSNHEFFTLKLTNDERIHIAVLDDLLLDHWMIDSQDEEDADYVGYKLNTWASDEAGPRVLQFYYGEGTFVAMSSASLWQNFNIGVGDHAYLLTYLIPEESTLQLFYNIKSPPFRSIIYKYFAELIWASLAFLALWLWYRGARTHRIRNLENTGRRNFIEHLKASANYFVSHKEYLPLIDSIRLDIEQQLRPRHPNFSTLSERAKIAILTDVTNLSPAAIESWLAYCQRIDSREHFFSALQLGNAIRKQL